MFDRARKLCDCMLAAGLALRSGGRRQPIGFVDIGSRGGLSRNWAVLDSLGLLRPMFFEPDLAAHATISARHPGATIFGEAVWSHAGVLPLHVTAHAGCSSLLRPAYDSRLPAVFRDMLGIARVVEVEAVRAEDVLRAHPGLVPEIIKIDVQGGELEVLRGFGDALRAAVCVELEVSFLRMYDDQPLFDEVYAFLVESGFGLVELRPFGVRSTGNAVQANAFFVRQQQANARQLLVAEVFRRACSVPRYH